VQGVVYLYTERTVGARRRGGDSCVALGTRNCFYEVDRELGGHHASRIEGYNVVVHFMGPGRGRGRERDELARQGRLCFAPDSVTTLCVAVVDGCVDNSLKGGGNLVGDCFSHRKCHDAVLSCCDTAPAPCDVIMIMIRANAAPPPAIPASREAPEQWEANRSAQEGSYSLTSNKYE